MAISIASSALFLAATAHEDHAAHLADVTSQGKECTANCSIESPSHDKGSGTGSFQNIPSMDSSIATPVASPIASPTAEEPNALPSKNVSAKMGSSAPHDHAQASEHRSGSTTTTAVVRVPSTPSAPSDEPGGEDRAGGDEGDAGDRSSSKGNSEGDTTFLSFDEWKKAKLSERAAGIERARKHEKTDTSYYRVDSIGDDMEIDLDLFTSSQGATGMDEDEPEGKLYKDKFNYASLDCAATIVKTNSEASGAASILHENKDKYLLNPCSVPNKFVIIELCEDILIEEVAMANYEFFSSTFRKVRFSASDRFPVPKNGWKVLGEFEAEKTRNLQKFAIPNPLIWARYLRVEILSHYDNEFYCPISVVRAHGKTMMEEFKMGQADLAKSEEMHGIIEGAEVPAGPSANVEQRLEEYVSSLEQAGNSDGADRCSRPTSLVTNNMSMLAEQDDGLPQCRAALPYLKFEEFLRELDGSPAAARLNRTLNVAASSPSPSSSSSTEESIFKNIVKRLSLLESNATLSVLYIEEQSKLLSKSFSNLEKNHAKRLDTLVQAFNQTIVSNLEVLNNFASQMRESSLKLLEEQRLANDDFTSRTLLRLESVEKDTRFQKRLTYIALFALVALLLYVLLTREAYIDEEMEDDGWYLDSPPLKKAKDKLLRKASGKLSLHKPLVFRATANTHSRGGRSVSSLSSSSTGSATSSDNDDNVLLSREERVRNYGLAYGAGSSGDGSGGGGGGGGGNSDSNIEDDVDIDELMSDQSLSTSLSRSSSQKSGHRTRVDEAVNR